jgi:two-component system phosphate regulon sensor histidine kinase PhoR
LLNSPFFRRLFLPYMLIICAATGAVGFFAARTVHSTYLDRQTELLRDNLRLVADSIAPQLAMPAPGLDQRVKKMGEVIGNRITVIRSDGVVIADSEADPAKMENHRLRPEFADAIFHGEGIESRPSDTIHTDLLYLARPMQDMNGKPILDSSGKPFYIRLAVHLNQLHHNVNILYAGLATAALLAIISAGVICFYFARRHTAPISDLTQFADALARGELSRRTFRDEEGEISTLATSLNTMAQSLSRMLEQSNKDKAELLTILSSMSEGVIATDKVQRILLINEAAGKLLGFDTTQAVGKHLWQVVRNDQIIKAASDVVSGSQQKLISIGPLSTRHLDVTLCTFPTNAPQGQAQGLVIVAHDITQSFQYEELRKEFVANVSHELRTPLTVIKGFVETLQDGAWRDQVKAPDYLATINRHTEQLTNLVGDLLELSKLESQGLSPTRAPVDLSFVLHKAQELLAPAVEKKKQTLTVDVKDLPTIKGNADYIERAVANLIDNASKYTPESGQIRLAAQSNGQYVVVEVSDNGIGIPAEDIPRIFERFYRVDRSRSREMGGTGLGLSIVKHVAQVHGGQIEVESTPGKGTTFRLKLPL